MCTFIHKYISQPRWEYTSFLPDQYSAIHYAFHLFSYLFFFYHMPFFSYSVTNVQFHIVKSFYNSSLFTLSLAISKSTNFQYIFFLIVVHFSRSCWKQTFGLYILCNCALIYCLIYGQKTLPMPHFHHWHFLHLLNQKASKCNLRLQCNQPCVIHLLSKLLLFSLNMNICNCFYPV